MPLTTQDSRTWLMVLAYFPSSEADQMDPGKASVSIYMRFLPPWTSALQAKICMRD